MKFAHEAIVCKQNGAWKVYCRCGVQSVKLHDETEAQQAYKEHLRLVGIVERQPRLVMH